MAHTLASLKTSACAAANIDEGDLVQTALDPGVSEVNRVPSDLVRRDLYTTVDPPEAYIEEARIDPEGVMGTNQGVDGDARVAISRQALRDWYGIASDVEADRRAYYIVEHLLGIIESTDATTGKHLVVGVGLVDN